MHDSNPASPAVSSSYSSWPSRQQKQSSGLHMSRRTGHRSTAQRLRNWRPAHKLPAASLPPDERRTAEAGPPCGHAAAVPAQPRPVIGRRNQCRQLPLVPGISLEHKPAATSCHGAPALSPDAYSSPDTMPTACCPPPGHQRGCAAAPPPTASGCQAPARPTGCG